MGTAPHDDKPCIVFPSDWEQVTPADGEVMRVDCPGCGAHDAEVDRVGNRVYGSHEGEGGCGWTASRQISLRGGQDGLYWG